MKRDRRKSGEGAMQGWQTRRANLKEKAAEAKRLWRSLLHYGHHTSNCLQHRRGECDCGWEELRETARLYAR